MATLAESSMDNSPHGFPKGQCSVIGDPDVAKFRSLCNHLAAMDHSNHEANDRSLFNRIAATYCDKDLFEPCRVARQLRLEQTIRCVPIDGGIELLEIGCGAGFTARYLAGTYSEYVGIDYADAMIERARTIQRVPHARFEAASVRAFDTRRRFDVILWIGVLHHLNDLAGSLANIVRLLKPGGWLVANEPQPANRVAHGLRLLRKRLDRKYSDDQRELTANELRAALQQANLTDIRIVPQGWFSTPFAEVPIGPRPLTLPVARLACWLDRLLARAPHGITRRLSWNLIAAGRKPAG
jgi:2-polyprenyl-3-methyl-5-hydroxy-6-metoxy-1,4-benzoquinol methylase